MGLDDVSEVRIDGSEHAGLANRLFGRLRLVNPLAQMLFCPTYNHGIGDEPQQRVYLETLTRELQSEVFLFRTGRAVIPVTVTREEVERFRRISGHRLFLWDNYPANDSWPTLHLGPLTGRAGICQVQYMAICPTLRTRKTRSTGYCF